MKVVAFLPVKGSSSRVEGKNLKLLDGKPLFLHTLEKLLMCDFIDEVYLDTESEIVINKASYLNHKVLKRDPSLANNKTDGNRLFMNEVRQINADIYIQILCTSPFIEIETIKNGIDKIKNSNYDSVVLVKNEKIYSWINGEPSYNLEEIPNSVDLPVTTIETMGLYIIKKEAALKHKRRVGDLPFLLEASPLEAIDVNYPNDFDLANLIAAGVRENDRKLLNNIKTHLSSSMLSDLLDDFGYENQVIRGLTPNLSNANFLGRAKTLKIRALREGEDYKGIYDALQSYKTIIPNDIILVENEVCDYAYFGELNANLAIRSGAAAAVIGGLTRDSLEVSKLGFPVFSAGYICQDVRKRATTESFNNPINIKGVKVVPGDLVYGDCEGIIVIPRLIENIVFDEIYKRLSNEKNILIDISMGSDVNSLVENYGFF